jgi:hypothetical protein
VEHFTFFKHVTRQLLLLRLGLQVFENRVLRKIFDPRKEVAGGWRRPHNEELHNLYALPNIVRVMKSRKMRLVGLVSRIREIKNAYKI